MGGSLDQMLLCEWLWLQCSKHTPTTYLLSVVGWP
jgi:hypothetical protein